MKFILSNSKYNSFIGECDVIFAGWQRIENVKLDLWYTNEPTDIHR